MRLFLVFLLVIQTTSVFAQNNDSSVIVKGHLRAILKKAQDEDKMILLFPVKKYILTDSEYPNCEIKINHENKAFFPSQVIEINRNYDLDTALNNLKQAFPKKYIITPIDLTYGEGLLLWNTLSEWISNFSINRKVILINRNGDFITTINNNDYGNVSAKNQSFQANIPQNLSNFWKKLPDYKALALQRVSLQKNYSKDKTNSMIIKELYKLNLYFDVMDCEVKDKYFEIRVLENTKKLFDEEYELLLYSCEENSKARDFFLQNSDRTKFSYFWQQKLYNWAVENRDSVAFNKYLLKNKLYLCNCSCNIQYFPSIKYAFDTGNKEQLKSYSEKFLNDDFFNTESTCWGTIKKKNAIFSIWYRTNEVAEFYYKTFTHQDDLNTALNWVNKVLTLKENHEIFYTKAKLLYKLGRIEEAKAIILNGNEKLVRNKFKIKNDYLQALKEIEEGTF